MLKILSLFSGIGAFEKALENLNVPFDLVAFCEFDKYATKSYCAIHNVDESKNLGDITKVDETKLPKNIDILTYGFPCQDISLAGKQQGLFNEDGTQTRSGLFFDALRIIKATKPKIAIAENVKNLTSKKFAQQFKIVLDSLEEAGYNNYWKVLNAKDYGVPQNRERVFIVSIRKDIDHGLFQFPEVLPLKKRLKDVLEDEVDEKYYLSEMATEKLVRWGNKITQNDTPDTSNTIHAGYYKMGGRDQQYIKENTDKILKCGRISSSQDGIVVHPDGIAPTHTAGHGNTPKIMQIGQMYPNSGNPQAGRIYDSGGISPTMDTCSGGNRMPKVLVRETIQFTRNGKVKRTELANTLTANDPSRTLGNNNPIIGVIEETEKILVREATKQGYAEACEGDSINLEHPNSKTRRGRVGKQVAQTLTTSCYQAVVVKKDE